MIKLSEGDIITAFMLNPVVWCLMPYFIVCVLCGIGQSLSNKELKNEGIGRLGIWLQDLPKSKLGRWCLSNRTIVGIMIILVVWMIIRNMFGLEAGNYA